MKRPLLILLVALISLPCLAEEKHSDEAPKIIGKVERRSPKLDRLIAPDTKIELLAEGFEWSEGPIWSSRENALLFSDVPENKVYRWCSKKGLSTFMKFSGYTGVVPKKGGIGSNGLAVDRNGDLILCQQGNRRLARLNSKGRIEPIVETFEDKHFNSPNDLVVARNGDIYFTDPPYGLPGKHDDPAKELPYAGVFHHSHKGETRLIIADLTFPNGIALSPNEKTLYVAVSDPSSTRLMAYDVKRDRSVANGRVFFDAQALSEAGGVGLCDGLKVDKKGNVFLTGPGGVLILSSKGEHLGTLSTGEKIANVAWGDDGKTLYMTSDMYLCRIKTKTSGL